MKNFTKQNFKTNPLWIRLLIMAFMLLAGAGNAWAWTIIYDNSDTKWDEVYLYIGKGDWSECNLKMTEYDTNLFVFKGSGWNDATEVAFANKPLGGSSTGNICTKLKNDNTVKPKVTYCHEKDFNKTYKYKATGLTSNDANCSNESRYYWPNTNDRVETTFNGAVIQLAGSFNDWGSSTDYCVSTNNSTCSFEKELAANDKYEFKIIIDGTWYSSGGSISVGGNKVTFYTDKGNSYFKAASDGIYTFNIDKDEKVWITYRTACTTPSAPQISGATSICSGESAEITVSGYSGSNTYTLYNGDVKQNNTISDKGKFTVNSTGKYYVTVTTCAESDPSNEVEISAKAVASAAGYNLKTKTAEWKGSAISVEIETNSGYPSIKNIYYDGSLEAPSAVGTYPITIDVNSNSTYCSKSGIEIGTFTITCPAPAEVPKFEVTQHEVVCGNTNIQKGIIKITNPVADYKYRLGNEGNTEYTLDANNSITGIDGGTKYRISAVRYCGTAKSSTTNEEKYAEISKTDVKLTPTLTSTPIIKCGEGDNAYSPGTLVITNYNANYDYTIAPNVGEPTIEGTNATYSINAQVATEYTVIATHKEYNCSSVQAKTTVALTDNTPTLEEISISSNVQIVCAGDNNVTLTCNLVGAVGTPTYKWTKNGEPVGDNSNTIEAGVLERNTTFSVSVILDNSGCTKEFTVSKELEVKARPEAPNLGSTGKTICYGTLVNLPMVDNNDANNQINWYNGKLVKPTNVPVLETTTFYAEAVSENGLGCPSNDKTPYTVTVNALPTITEISGNNSAVLYEDVELTATGVTQGAEVRWYLGNDVTPVATGTTYVVTSENAGEVIVKAKAFLNGCESAVASHTVVFSAETCNNVADMTKIYFDTKGNSNFNDNVYLSVAGNTYNKNRSADCNDTGHAGDYWPGEDGTFHKMTKIAGTNIYYVNKPASIPSGKISIWNKNQQGNNNVWQAHVILAKSIDNNNNCLVLGSSSHHNDRQSDVYCSTWTTYKNAPAISAPAVKTVSFETTPGDGNINFSGQIVKTGCDNSLTYGYEYKKVGAANWTQVVLGTDLDKDAGFTFSDNNDKDLDGEYVVRAFITNDNSTQYGAEITKELSTTKDPVTEATITLTDAEGKEVDKKYCVGETAYIMVESDVKYTEISWKSQQGVDIVQTRLMNMYQFVVKGNDNIVVLLSNKYNVTPAESNTKEVYTFADPILPRVSLNKVSICSNDEVGATVKLTNVVKGQTYQLYQQIDNGDDTFTEQAIGEAKTQTEEVTDKTELVLHTLNNTYTTGKYFVKTYTSDCEENKVATQPFTFTVVDAAEVFISIDPASAETTPWMPAKFTVSASDAYTLNVTKGNPAEAATEVEVNQNGNKVSVKIPLPQGSTLPEGTTGVYGQYENVVFPQGATTQYTITATLSATGGDNPCADPASATVNLVPYVEECTVGH